MKKRLQKIFLLLVIIFPLYTFSQDFDLGVKIPKVKGFKVGGGFGFNSIYFNSNQELSGRDPFTYNFTGNLNFQIGDFNIPFNFIYSSEFSNVTSPIDLTANFELHPRYKWIQTHIGDISMSFSPYTYQGHQFRGAGVELTPDNWEFKLFGGRLQKAVIPVTNSTNSNITVPAFERWGYGLFTKYLGEDYTVFINYFYGSDDKNSFSINEANGLKPMENLVFSAGADFKFLTNMRAEFEYGNSVLIEDLNVIDPTDLGVQDIIIGNKATAKQYHAIKTKVAYEKENFSLGLGFEQVDPFYRTLGTYFTNNDFRNYTVNTKKGFFDNKLFADLTFGFQEDNIKNQKSASNENWNTSLNLNGSIGEKLSLNASYSNFSSYSVVRNQFDLINVSQVFSNLDNYRYSQISSNINTGINYNLLNTEEKNSTIVFNYTFQTLNDEQGNKAIADTFISNNSKVHNALLNYSISLTEAKVDYGFNLIYTSIGFNSNVDKTAGIGVTASKTLEKLKFNFSSTFTNGFNKETGNKSFVNQINVGYEVLKNPITLRLSSISNTPADGLNRSDIILEVGYNYSF